MAKSKKDVSEKKMKKEIGFKIADSDAGELGRKQAKLYTLWNQVNNQFSSVKKDYAGRLEKIDMEIAQIAKWFEDGERREVVDVIERMDYNKRKVSYVHKGKTVEERDMTPQEMQMELKLDPPKKVKQPPGKVLVRNPADGEVQEVIKEETSKRTKRSAVDSKMPAVAIP